MTDREVSWDAFVDQFLDGTIRFEDGEVHLSVEDWNQMWENIRRTLDSWKQTARMGRDYLRDLNEDYIEEVLESMWLVHALRLREGDRVRVERGRYQGTGVVDRARTDDHYLHFTRPDSDVPVRVGVRLVRGHDEVRYYDVRDVELIDVD